MPAPLDRDFDVALVDAECVGFPAYAFRFDQHRPAPHKGIEDKAVAPGIVLDGIRYQSDRLDSRMHRKFLKPTKLRSVYASIVPYIRTRPAMLTKLDRVDMRRTAVLPHERRRGDRVIECAARSYQTTVSIDELVGTAGLEPARSMVPPRDFGCFRV